MTRVAEKRSAEDALVDEYTSLTIEADSVRRVIDSIADGIAYVESNVAPVKRMLQYLEENYDPRNQKMAFLFN